MQISTPLPRPTNEGCAFIGGYFDAEGCLSLHEIPLRTCTECGWGLAIGFGQTNPSVLKYMHSFYGGRLSPVKKDPPPNWRRQTVWQLRKFRGVCCFLQDILPYLGEKRAQVEAVLQRFNARMTREAGDALQALLTVEKKLELQYLPVELSTICQAPPSLTERAYAAGFFDGDGSIEVRRKTSTWHLTVTFNQTRKEGILKLAANYLGYSGFKIKVKPRRNQLSWRISVRETVLTFLRDIQPFSIEKKPQIDLILTDYSPLMSDFEGLVLNIKLEMLRQTIESFPCTVSLTTAMERVLAIIQDANITTINQIAARFIDGTEALPVLLSQLIVDQKIWRKGKGKKIYYGVATATTDNWIKVNRKDPTATITIEGETKSIKEWAMVTGLDYQRVHTRLKKGLTPKEAVFSPLRGTGLANLYEGAAIFKYRPRRVHNGGVTVSVPSDIVRRIKQDNWELDRVYIQAEGYPKIRARLEIDAKYSSARIYIGKRIQHLPANRKLTFNLTQVT